MRRWRRGWRAGERRRSKAELPGLEEESWSETAQSSELRACSPEMVGRSWTTNCCSTAAVAAAAAAAALPWPCLSAAKSAPSFLWRHQTVRERVKGRHVMFKDLSITNTIAGWHRGLREAVRQHCYCCLNKHCPRL